MILDKEGREIGIHDKPGNFKISAYERDRIYQDFLAQFPDPQVRYGILKESLDKDVVEQATRFFESQSKKYPVSAKRIYDFVSEAVATEAGHYKSDPNARWDWWVGCSLQES